MAQQHIDPKKAPIRWDTIDEAFNKINDNFTELYLSVGGSGSAVDLTSLNTDIIPGTSEVYDLGSSSKRWRHLYLSGSSLYIGNARITASGATIQLPEGSTIGGALLDNTYFKYISVDGQDIISASIGGEDTLILESGNDGITLTTDAVTKTLTISNSGILSIAGETGGIDVSNDGNGNITLSNLGVKTISQGDGIVVTGSAGNFTVSNDGVIQISVDPGLSISDEGGGIFRLTNTAPNIVQNIWRFIAAPGSANLDPQNSSDVLTFAFGDGMFIETDITTDTVTFTNTGVTSVGGGTGISVSAGTGSVTISNDGVTSISAGTGISISAGTGDITISNSRVGFTSIAVPGQNPVLADNTTDTLVLIAGTGVELITDPTTDSITISANANLQSNVYGENSSLLVDSANNQIVGDINTADARTDLLIIKGVDDYNTLAINPYTTDTVGGRIYYSNGGNRLEFITNSGGDIRFEFITANAGMNAEFFSHPGTISAEHFLGTDISVNDILSENDITININLSDSTKRTWKFSEGGDLVFPNGSSISSEDSGAPTLVIDGGGNYVDIRDRGTILIGYNSTGNVQIGNPEGGTFTEILSERVKFLSQTVPASSIGVTGDDPGLVAFDATYMYYCAGTYDGITHIWKRIAWSGDTW